MNTHEHYTQSKTGHVIWSTEDECVVCGSGTPYFGE